MIVKNLLKNEKMLDVYLNNPYFNRCIDAIYLENVPVEECLASLSKKICAEELLLTGICKHYADKPELDSLEIEFYNLASILLDNDHTFRGYKCTHCGRFVSFDDSFSDAGGFLHCRDCVNKLAKEKGISVTKYVKDYIFHDSENK